MARFAENTSVAPEKTRAEIEQTLRRYGADQFISGWDGNLAVLGFRCRDRQVRFTLRLPDRSEKRFLVTPKQHHRRSPEDAMKAWEQEVRSRWRALLLVIKAKLESVESGIECFEEAFLAQIVIPGGTVGDLIVPQLAEAYERGTVPRLLPALPAPREKLE